MRWRGWSAFAVSSIDPDEVDEDLADAILNGKRTCPSDARCSSVGIECDLKADEPEIYARDVFRATVDRLKAARADFTFTTDIIVGFPGESERDFEDTLAVMEKVRFAKIHMFPYSPRKRTRAALYPHPVPPPVIQERKQRLLRLAEQQAFALREEYRCRDGDLLKIGPMTEELLY